MKTVSFKETHSLLEYELSYMEKIEKQKCYRDIKDNIFKNDIEYKLEKIIKKIKITLVFYINISFFHIKFF